MIDSLLSTMPKSFAPASVITRDFMVHKPCFCTYHVLTRSGNLRQIEDSVTAILRFKGREHPPLFPSTRWPRVTAAILTLGNLSPNGPRVPKYLYVYKAYEGIKDDLVFFVFVNRAVVPAFLMLGYWFVIQVLAGIPALASEAGGVAFWAHVGGFLAGVALVPVFARPERVAAHRALLARRAYR